MQHHWAQDKINNFKEQETKKIKDVQEHINALKHLRDSQQVTWARGKELKDMIKAAIKEQLEVNEFE